MRCEETKWVPRPALSSVTIMAHPYNIQPRLGSESSFSKRLAVLQTVIPFRRLVERLASALAPVKFPSVDNYTADGGSVTSDPFRRRVNDNVCSVLYGSDNPPSLLVSEGLWARKHGGLQHQRCCRR